MRPYDRSPRLALAAWHRAPAIPAFAKSQPGDAAPSGVQLASCRPIEPKSRNCYLRKFSLSIWCKRDDHGPVVMDEPPSFDTLIARDEIDAGPSPCIAWGMEQRLRLFTAQIQVRLLGVREMFA